MPFNVHFNLAMDVWEPGHNAAAHPPDHTCQAQLYLVSKPMLDVTPGAPGQWVPPVLIRISISTSGLIGIHIVDTQWGYTDSTGRHWYYVARYWDIVHSGFPNEYVQIVCDQCTSARAVPDTGR